MYFLFMDSANSMCLDKSYRISVQKKYNNLRLIGSYFLTVTTQSFISDKREPIESVIID